MTDQQTNEIIEVVLKAHWPNWDFSGEEGIVWVKALRPFDFTLAREAINTLYESWDKERYPKMPHIMAAIRFSARFQRQSAPMAKLYAIFRSDGRLRWQPFWGNSQTPREEIEVEAGQKLARANEVEPGHYIQYYKLDGCEDTGYYGDPKLSVPERRAMARDKAFADILNGPNDKTQQWLIKYLNRKEKASERISTPRTVTKKTEQSVTVGQVLDDSIPF